MATTNKDKIFIGVNNERIELVGQELEKFLIQREADSVAFRLVEAEYEAKKQLRIDAITKLGAASGLSEAEINSILNI